MQELVRWWEAVHYTALRRRCAEAGMHNLAAKQATSLLRYIGAVPADKAFYEAGKQHALSATLVQATRDQSVLYLCMLPELWLVYATPILHSLTYANCCLIQVSRPTDRTRLWNHYIRYFPKCHMLVNLLV
jgi:hypothetical protein